ncbi:MAG TPA: hypothetical protein VFC06_03855 [Demequina sp.]|nr:hypothetical protein [Demequina sp.]
MWLAPSHPGSLLFLGTAYTVIGTAVIEYPPTHVAKGTTVSQEEWGIYLVGLAVVFLIGFLFSAVAITTRQWILTRFGDPDRALGRAAAALLREIIRPQTPELQHKRTVLAAIRAIHERAPRAGITDLAALEHFVASAEPRASLELARNTRALIVDHVHGNLISLDRPVEQREWSGTVFGSRLIAGEATGFVFTITLLTAVVGLVRALVQ